MHAEDLATASAGFSSAVTSANTAPTKPAAQALAQPSGIRNKKLGCKVALLFNNIIDSFLYAISPIVRGML